MSGVFPGVSDNPIIRCKIEKDNDEEEITEILNLLDPLPGEEPDHEVC